MAIIPVLTYLSFWIMLCVLQPAWGWRRSALRAAVLWGAFAIVTTEMLSSVSQITRSGLLAVWLIPLILCVAILGFRLRRRSLVRVGDLRGKLGWVEGLLLLGIMAILIVTAIVAWHAPPQTWDSLNYHMARVAHWAQQRSVQHYPTGIEIQNSRTPAAEFMVLHTYVLSAGDRPANFVQWSAMLLSVMGVSLVAAQLGAGRRGQLGAALFTATLPMGIVQASSTTTDYLVALWVLAAASEALTLRIQGPRSDMLPFLGLAAGLGLATKPTAVAYLAPIGAYVGYLLIRENGLWGTARWALAAMALIGMLNVGYVARNVKTYSSPFNPAQVAIHSNQLRTVRGLISNLIRHAGLHAGTPWPHVNKGLAIGVQWAHGLMGLQVNDPRTTAHGVFKISPPTTNEDRAGNPLHAYLLLALAGYAAIRRRSIARVEWVMGSLLILSIVALSFLFKWQIFASRYHLPFFVLAGAFAGSLLERAGGGKGLPLVAAAMLIGASPWLFQIKSRPLIAAEDATYVESILREPRQELYLANGANLLDPYLAFTGRLREASCGRVGLALAGNAAEYPLWAYLEAPISGVEIQWIVAGTPSARDADKDYQPCGIICESCPPDWLEFRGLPLVETRAEFQLYQAALGEPQ